MSKLGNGTEGPGIISNELFVHLTAHTNSGPKWN